MDTPHPNRPESAIVYIRALPVKSLPEPIRAQLPGVEQVWGVLSPEGECLALARDRTTAFVMARQNDLIPVSAH